MGTNLATGNDDLLYTWMGIGSQLDGLGHMGINHVYYNGHKAADFVTTKGLTALSIDKLPPMVGRGVLLDMTRHYGENPLNPRNRLQRGRNQGPSRRAGRNHRPRRHRAVPYRLAQCRRRRSDLHGRRPGLGLNGAKYLASLDVVAVGADSWGLEAVPGEDPNLVFPVHPELLAKNGIYILENMNVAALAADEAWEFLFVLGQPRFEGAVQAVINPVAIR